jgi:hypothetical protein
VIFSKISDDVRAGQSRYLINFKTLPATAKLRAPLDARSNKPDGDTRVT